MSPARGKKATYSSGRKCRGARNAFLGRPDSVIGRDLRYAPNGIDGRDGRAIAAWDKEPSINDVQKIFGFCTPTPER